MIIFYVVMRPVAFADGVMMDLLLYFGLFSVLSNFELEKKESSTT